MEDLNCFSSKGASTGLHGSGGGGIDDSFPIHPDLSTFLLQCLGPVEAQHSPGVWVRGQALQVPTLHVAC